MRIINKRGPLHNPADRDHCIQYMTAVALLNGDLTAEDYEDQAAADPRIDALREKMEVVERPSLFAGLSRSRQALHRQRDRNRVPATAAGASGSKSSIRWATAAAATRRGRYFSRSFVRTLQRGCQRRPSHYLLNGSRIRHTWMPCP